MSTEPPRWTPEGEAVPWADDDHRTQPPAPDPAYTPPPYGRPPSPDQPYAAPYSQQPSPDQPYAAPYAQQRTVASIDTYAQQPYSRDPYADPYAGPAPSPSPYAYSGQPGFAAQGAHPGFGSGAVSPSYPIGSYPTAGYAMPFMYRPPLAGWGQRVAGSLIDGAVPGVLMTIGYFAFFAALVPTAGASPDPGLSSAGFIVLLVTWLVSIVFWVWNRVVRQGRTGQSLGKSALGLRLVSESTMLPPGMGMAFARELAHYVDSAIYVGYLWPLWDAKKQTLADKICSTVVLSEQ